MDWKTRIPALILWLALVLPSLGDVNAEQRVVCYYTNWSVYRPGTAKFSPQNINPYLCTHLIYAFGGFTKENTLKPFDKYQDIEKGGYAKFTGLKTYNKNLKTMLAIGGWNEGSSRFSPMVADPKRRKEFVKNSVKFLRQNHFDGLDLDWEYPAFRDGGKPRDRKNYADLVQELREEYERESSKTGRPRLLLSMAVPAGIEYIDKGYDIPRLNDYLDFINLLSYDYHSAFEPAVNHHAPLYPLEEANEYNYDTELTIDYTIEHLLKSGASSEKIVLGIPTYGRSYTLFNEDATEIGAPADGPGEEGDATREKGYLAYYEICDNVGKSDEWEVVQPNPSAMGPYAYRENQWVGYDDEDIVRAKARYVNEKKLGGIMFWSIDNDDFRGKCHGRPYPLIEAAKEALFAGDERSPSGQKTKLSDSRKKSRIQGSGQRIQGNSIGRKLGSGNRRSTTQAPVSRRRKTSSRFNARSNGRGGASNYNAEEDEEDEEEEANSVKTIEKARPRSHSKSRSSSRSSAGGRRKQSSRRGEDEKEESFSNKLSTPEPPTTPDPGSDFKCEDEGFFSHPRDCKKYFWCLDSGPGGLGIVGHQFTCPSGLVFNKAADSCDYPRNVVCPKTKPAEATVSTTRAPITAATSRTTYLYKPTRTTTSKPESDEEYEYYDDEEVADSEEVEEEPIVTTSAKPLVYKTINRSRPTTTTLAPVTTTTETHIAASTRTYKATTERVTSFEDEEDPRVIKELIDLIKKAGGIEQLEKQLNYQEKNSGGNSGTTEGNGRSTPATISRSLYERVLNRQAAKIGGGLLGSLSTTQSTNGDKSDRADTKNSRTGFVNGPGGAQFEGLDNVPEVKNLRRTNKPQYVTIERHRSPTSESPAEDDEQVDDEVDEDNRDVASSEDQAVSNLPHQKTPNRRVTPSYVNIRRPRPTTTTSENDVDLKDEDSNDDDAEEEEETVHQRHHVAKTEEESSSPKSRYTNTQRFRSTTSRNSEEDQAEEVVSKNDFTTESTTTTTTPTTTSTTTTTTTTTEKVTPVTEEIAETPSPSTAQSTTTPESSTSSIVENFSSSIESTTSSIPEPTSDSSLKLVENSATEILFTTAAASSSSTGSRPEPFTRGPSIAAVSQPRPFGFPRRGRPTASTSSVAPVTEQSRTKVVSEALRLPTLKELVGYTPTQTESIAEFASTIAQSLTSYVDRTIGVNASQVEFVDRAVSGDEPEILIKDFANRDESDDGNARDAEDERDREIFDNDILGSEEIQRRSSAFSFVEGTPYPRSTSDREKIDPEKSTRRLEVPVRILDDANGEEIAELVILRLPESKLNSAILKPVFRVKVLEQDEKTRDDTAREGVESVSGSNEISSENELPDDRVTSPRRRRVRVNSLPSSAAPGDTGKASEDRADAASRPRSRQRIVKARRRTRVQEVASNDSGVGASIPGENGQVPVGGENSRRGESFDEESSSVTDVTTVQPTESSTAVRATTLRGNVTAPSKAPSVIRGFYVTKSSVEASSTPDVMTTDSSTDPTRYPSGFTDETVQKTDFTTQSDETVTPFVEGVSDFADESSTYESIGSTLLEPEAETRISNDSLENVASTVGEKLETPTTDEIATSDDPFTETGPAATMTETSDQPEVTTFRPWTSGEVQTTHLTTTAEATTTEYFTESSSETIEEESDSITDHPSETLKTSENSRYGDSPNLVVRSTTAPTTVASDDEGTASELQTERSARRTTTPSGKATHKEPLKRGRVRFTNASKPDSSELSSSEHPRVSTKTSRGESDEKSRTSTEIYDETVEHGSPETTGSLRLSSLRSRDHRRRTTTSLSIDESTTGSPPGRDNFYGSSTESHVPPVKYSSRTSSVETTGNSPTSRSFSRSKDHSRGTTKTFETDTSAVSPASTEAYDETGRYTSFAEVQKTGKNFVEATGSEQLTSRSKDHSRGTTKTFETETSAVSATSTEAYDETRRYTSAAEVQKTGTNFVEATGSAQLTSRNKDHSRGTTKTFETETSAVSTTSTEAYDDTGRYTSAAEVQKTGTNFVEVTGSAATSRSKDRTRGTTKTFETDTSGVGATSTEAYDDTGRYTSAAQVQKTGTNFVEVTGSAATSRTKDHSRGTTKTFETETSTVSATSTEAYDDTGRYPSAAEVQKAGRNFVEATGSALTSGSDDARKTTETPEDPDDLSVDSTTGRDSTTSTETNDNGEETVEYATATPEADYPITNLVGTTGSFFYGRTLPQETGTVATTTESYDKITETFEPANTVYIDSDREEEARTESTLSIGTTSDLAETTRPWSYLQRKRVTVSASVGNAESIDVSNDVTLDLKTDTFEPTTEVYPTTDRTEMSAPAETEISGTKINDEYGISTESVEKPTETMTSPETTLRSFSATPISTIDDKIEETTTTVHSQTKTDNSVESKAEESSSTYRGVSDGKSTTESSDEKKVYFTVDPTRNTIAPVTEHRETKRVRGRVRFTNFAAHPDETGRNRRPVKQVVVRRRPVTESSDRYRTVDSSSERSVESETLKTSRQPIRQTAEETKNSVELHERFDGKEDPTVPNVRPIGEKNRSTNLSDRSAEKKKDKKDSARPNDRSAEEKKYSSRVNDRLTGKKYSSRGNDRSALRKNSADSNDRSAERKNSADLNDRSAEEKKYSSRVNDRSAQKKNSAEPNDRSAQKNNSPAPNDRSAEEKIHPSRVNGRLADDNKNRTKSMRRRVIVYRGRPRPEIVTSTTTMQSLRASSDEIPDDSGRKRRRKWRKRVVLKRERTEEADDQSIAETVDFRRAVIDASLADFQDLGSSVEDPDLASSAEQADEDNGGEANPYKSSGGFLRRPGSLVRGQGNNRSKTKTPGNSDSIILPVGQPSVFSKMQPIVAAQEIKTDDQSGRAQELAVTLADPPVVSSATTGRLPFRTTSSPRKISTTIAPRTEAPATSRTTPLVRRRQRPRGSASKERIVENVTTRPRRPAIIDYDYYVDDDDVRLVVKPELKDKLFVTRKGGIRCLDQGNFAHPTSCKKFITCARMVNGQVIGTEYTCPDKLSFDPVGGICNWSAGLGCEDNKKT